MGEIDTLEDGGLYLMPVDPEESYNLLCINVQGARRQVLIHMDPTTSKLMIRIWSLSDYGVEDDMLQEFVHKIEEE